MLQTPLNMRLVPVEINAPPVTAIVTRRHQSRLRFADAAKLLRPRQTIAASNRNTESPAGGFAGLAIEVGKDPSLRMVAFGN
jgi:hypothetical protein